MKYLSLASRNLKEIYRDPVTLLLGIGMPVAFLILFTSLYEKSHLEIFSPDMLTPGIAIFSYAFLIMFSAILLAKDKQSAFLTRLFATPLKPSDFILAYMLPFIPIAFVQTVICLATGIILGAAFHNLIISILIFLLIALICISTGMILGALFTVNQVSGIGSILITAISLFSGAWMDLEMVGGVFAAIGYVLPFAHAVDVTRGVLSGADFAATLGSFYILTGYAVVLFVLAILAFKRSMKKI